MRIGLYQSFVYLTHIYNTLGLYRALARDSPSPPKLTYAQAGVSVDAGNSLVEAIKPLVRSTRRPGADGEIGGFGGVFDLKATGYKDPVLVSGTDGVGTKLRVAVDAGIHDLVGERSQADQIHKTSSPFQGSILSLCPSMICWSKGPSHYTS